MTTQYNVVTYGSLTNTNGVLSGFSSDNYATIPLNFNPTQKPYEVVFKFVGTNGIIWNVGDVTTARGHIEFEIYQNKLYAEFAANTTLIWSIEGVTTLSSNTNYWVKLTYNGVDTYGLYLSTDGTTWNTEGTVTSSAFLADGSTQYNLIGCQTDNGAITYSFDGSIDLNESYINIDNIRWWQGATVISNVRTKIQLRHDTAANWTSINPILLEGEVGIETDTRKQKFGDGVTAWNSLPYDKGSTALQSITSSDVTTALGYTPVNKSGDTMSGTLQVNGLIKGTSGFDLINNALSKGTNPASASYWGIRMTDGDSSHTTWQSNRFGIIESSVMTDGSTKIQIATYKNEANSTYTASMNLMMSASGVPSCTFPNTTCCDGQWVDSFHLLSSQTAQGNYEIDVSSFLPADSSTYNYEIMLAYAGYRSSGTTNSVVCVSDISVSLASPAGTSLGSYAVYGVTEFDGEHKECGEFTCIVVIKNSSRKFYLNISRANLTNSALIMTKYRRVGTNG